MNSKILILLIFLLTYLFFVILPSKRTISCIVSSFLLLIICKIYYNIIPYRKIDFNVINIFIGTLLVSNLIVESNVAEFIAERILLKVKSARWTFLLLCIITGFLSIFIENVAALIIVAPVAFQVAKKTNINPTKLIFAIAISSNLQGTATLIGDPPSMILAGATSMNFVDFFFYKGKPSIFFAVELGAITSFFVLYFIFSDLKNNKIEISSETKVISWIPIYILFFKILLLIIFSLINLKTSNFLSIAGLICLFFGFISLLFKKFKFKTSLLEGIKNLDWETVLFLIGIFILVESIEISGWIKRLGSFLIKIIGDDKFLIYSIFVLFSILISGFVDNVPFFATMVPIAKIVSFETKISLELLLFGLLIGTTLGGNITPTGASANIVAWGMLKKNGFKTTFLDFLKIGLPFTIFAVLPSYYFIWLVWKK